MDKIRQQGKGTNETKRNIKTNSESKERKSNN